MARSRKIKGRTMHERFVRRDEEGNIVIRSIASKLCENGLMFVASGACDVANIAGVAPSSKKSKKARTLKTHKRGTSRF